MGSKYTRAESVAYAEGVVGHLILSDIPDLNEMSEWKRRRLILAIADAVYWAQRRDKRGG